MKRLIAILFPVCFMLNAYGQISEQLASLGLEDVRTMTDDETTYVSWEDNRYRSTYTGISAALRAVLEVADTCHNVEYVVTRAGIPELHLAMTSQDIAELKGGVIDFVELIHRMTIDYDTDASWHKVQSAPKQNRASWKADFVIYPQLGLDNTTLEELYQFYINLAPAMEMELWKGARLTLQGVFPIVTNMDNQFKKIRPGYMTLSQDFDLNKGFKLRVTAGNFNSNRAGGAIDLKWRTKNGRLEVGARTVLTVQSIVTSEQGWTFSSNPKFSGSLFADYYIPRFDTEVKAQFLRYVYGDNGIRADITRHFGEYTIGIYALYVKCDEADNNYNAGFNFSIPLPGKKFMKNRGVRVRPARNWGMEYSIKGIWNHDGLNNVTKNVKPSHTEGDAGLFLQPDYIRHFIIKEYQKGKQL